MGTPDFAVGTLKALLDSEYTVSAVFTQPDKPKGRKGILTPPPVKECAVEAGIPVYQPKRIRDPENLVFLKNLEPDVIVVVAFGQILPQEILDLPPFGCINVHASLLPRYRGAAPIQWAIIDGEKESGVTTMRMDAGLDTGDMIMKETVPIRGDETGGSLFDRLSAAGASLLIRTLHALEDQTAVFEKQPEISPTRYASMLSKEDGRIRWEQSAAAIERLIRGVSPWPGAHTTLSGKQLKIWKAHLPETEEENSGTALPGTLVSTENGTLLVQTGDGLISLDEVQLEGRKRMDAASFLRGFHTEDAMVLI